jgi:ADP-dependent NAD(P)H-hydrate dehydratase / NAD(P)H-hydrate epimerase
MQPVVTAAEMRELDRATMEEIGIPGIALMETAGRAVAAAALRMLEGGKGRVAVVCGPGNNGGDGFVIARVLRGQGIDATAYLAAARAVIRGYAREHLEILERAGGVVIAIDTPGAFDEQRAAIASALLVVDALFGVGQVRTIEGHLAAVITAMNEAPRRLAVDIPSGLDTDTGRTLGTVVMAERTVTMGALKIALVSSPGFAACGELELADIGIPRALIAASNVRAGLVERADVARWLPRPRPLDHKGRRGHVLVAGGGPGMRGAGRLAAMAALRAGAGLVTLAAIGTPDVDALGAADAVMTRALDGPLGPLLDGKAAIVIGPGLGMAGDARARVVEALASGVPAVLDADALNLLASAPGVIAGAAGPVVITPHPGEAARLLGGAVPDVERDRLAAARALAAKTRAVVVLKGARAIVCDGTLGDEHCAINPTGGPALATAGSGDVLAGTIGALLAQGLPAGDAARAGAYVHGAAGDALGAAMGRGAIASDLPAAIAAAIHELAGGR